jgi:hypothetical protein
MIRIRRARSAGLAVAAVVAALGSGGCVMGGLAAMGPLVGAVYAVADRSVERSLPADLDSAWTATVQGLSRVAVRVKDVDRTGQSWSLTGVGDRVTITATLAPLTPKLTKLSLRVESGGITADKKSAEEILNQVSTALAEPGALAEAREPVGSAAAQTEAMTSLKREIERLGSKLEETRDQRPTVSSGHPVIEQGRILVVPRSLGVESVPWVGAEHGPALGAAAALDGQPALREPSADADSTGDATGSPNSLSPTALRPVQGLRPVAGLAPGPSEQ